MNLDERGDRMQIKLYELRKKAGLTQAQMAKKLDISENSYRMKELGRTDFKLTEMYRIANLFNKDIGDIFTDSTSRNVKYVRC
ncbi:helix-turn-helix domain-containing protein [Streptococcus henryi]|uniref:helix-turn-helix domain-containing protein n=1 Tax=Streptococcus henryi TaxID=439219 RepID=UPI00037D6509